MIRLMLGLAVATIVMLNVVISAPVQAATYTLEPNADSSSINLNVSGGGSNWAADSASDDSPHVWCNQNGWRIDANAKFGAGCETSPSTSTAPPSSAPAFPSIFIGIAAALGIGILVYFMRSRLIRQKG